MSKPFNPHAACCMNDKCVSRYQCWRWQKGRDRNPDHIYGSFAPSQHAQKCRNFIKCPDELIY